MAIRDNGLSVITVKKAVLLEALTKNRKQHAADYAAAEKGYRERVIAKLTSMLRDAESGGKIRVDVGLEAPHDHTKDYDRVIGMLEMSISDEVQITEVQFDHYVRDEWDWARHTKLLNSQYSGG